MSINMIIFDSALRIFGQAQDPAEGVKTQDLNQVPG